MLLIALLFFQFTAPFHSNIPQPSSRPLSSTDGSIRQMERSAFDLVNRERLNKGLAPLIWSDELAVIAREHSDEMAKFFYMDHTDREGRDVAGRAHDAGKDDWRSIGENLAYNSGYAAPVEHAVAGWMTSPHHRENILSGVWSQTGIGISVNSQGGYYFTQVFYSIR